MCCSSCFLGSPCNGSKPLRDWHTCSQAAACSGASARTPRIWRHTLASQIGNWGALFQTPIAGVHLKKVCKHPCTCAAEQRHTHLHVHLQPGMHGPRGTHMAALICLSIRQHLSHSHAVQVSAGERLSCDTHPPARPAAASAQGGTASASVAVHNPVGTAASLTWPPVLDQQRHLLRQLPCWLSCTALYRLQSGSHPCTFGSGQVTGGQHSTPPAGPGHVCSTAYRSTPQQQSSSTSLSSCVARHRRDRAQA